MVTVSAFLSPSTANRITPRCYPSLMNLEAVEDLNWCQFVVDQLKSCGNKMDKRDSASGCLFFLVVLYLDSLIHGVEISNCTLRVGAWNKDVLKKVVKLDMNRNGSFGKLMLKEYKHTSVLFPLEEMENFVLSMLSGRHLSQQKKRKLAEAVRQLFTGLIDLLGNLVQVSEVAESSEPSEEPDKSTEDDEDEYADKDSGSESSEEQPELESIENDEDGFANEDSGSEDDEMTVENLRRSKRLEVQVKKTKKRKTTNKFNDTKDNSSSPNALLFL